MATARYLPGGGGTAVHTHEVARRLAARGVDVTVLSTEPERSSATTTVEEGVRVVRLRAWPRHRDYYFAPGLVGHIRPESFDLVHCQGYHTLVAPLVMLTAALRHIPYILTLHSGGHSSPIRRAIRPAQARLLRPLITRAVAIVAVSQFEADLFARRLRLTPADFRVIPSGVDLPPPTDPSPVSSEPLIVCVGRLERYKGHQRVIEALPIIRQGLPGTRLRIAGSGPYEPALRRLADRLGVGDLVEIAAIPTERRSELAQLLREASVVAILSEYESQGLAVHEALALGCPLVVSHTGAIPELQTFGNVRVLLRSAPALEVAAAIMELVDQRSVAASPAPSWESCVAALLKLYASVEPAR